MPDPNSVILVGGPDAGKTNYLTRFWIAVQAGAGALTAAGPPADAEYLNTNAHALLGGEYAPRTSKDVHARNEIPVAWGGGATGTERGVLVVPDCSGEEWEKIHHNREWSAEWESVLPSLAGCLLFVRAGSDKIVAPLDWMSCHQLFGRAVELAPAGGLAAAPDFPTQVLVVDWLQCLREAVASRAGPRRRLRVAVVVSAWDRVPTDLQPAGPNCYVAENYRMLSDFILSNEGVFEFAHFGVSVTGGDLDAAPGFKNEYLSGNPAQAGYVVHTLAGGVARSEDHTLPVAWAMGVPITPAALATRSAV